MRRAGGGRLAARRYAAPLLGVWGKAGKSGAPARRPRPLCGRKFCLAAAPARPARFWVDIRRRVRYSGFIKSRAEKPPEGGWTHGGGILPRVARRHHARGAAAALDEGLTVTVGGGRSHIGSVAIAQPRPACAGTGASPAPARYGTSPATRTRPSPARSPNASPRAQHGGRRHGGGPPPRRGRGADRSGGAAGGRAGGKAPGGPKARWVRQKKPGNPAGVPGFLARGFPGRRRASEPEFFAYRTTPSIRTGSSDRGRAMKFSDGASNGGRMPNRSAGR